MQNNRKRKLRPILERIAAGKTQSKNAHDLLVEEFEADAFKISKYNDLKGPVTFKKPVEPELHLPQKRNLTISIPYEPQDRAKCCGYKERKTDEG